MTEVIQVPRSEIKWSFDSAAPYVNAPRRVTVDPFPAYGHNAKLVESVLHQLAVEDIGLAPRAIYILEAEATSRTNGWAEADTDWDDEAEAWVAVPGTITLSGKRIPPHPAVTRYVVSHEFAHHVQYDMQARRGEDAHDDTLLKEYAEVRGLDPDLATRYGGGYWHTNAGEVFANDWRVLVTNIECAYWPHPGVTHPESVVGLIDWWREAL